MWLVESIMNEIKCELVFPTTIYSCKINDIYRDTLIEYTRYKQAYSSGVQKTNMNGGWQSVDNFLDTKICELLKKDLEEVIGKIKNSLNIVEELRIFNSWVNVNAKGSYNVRHIHPRSFLSGVYYLQTPENCGNIVFHSPLIAKEMIDPNYNELNLVNSNVLIYPAVAGSVYLFPSWLEHSVQTNNSSDDRISVSFNVFFDKF